MNAPSSADGFVSRPDTAHYETGEPVKYAVADGIATLTMSRPDFNNVQNSQMTYALDAAFRRAVDDDAVKERAPAIEKPMHTAMALCSLSTRTTCPFSISTSQSFSMHSVCGVIG